jgi:DNA-binding transcriptional MerR regulator
MTPHNPADARYSLTELADLAGVTPRTVRYYLSQGLLPVVGVGGPGAKYDDSHLARLRLIRRLQREHLPLAEIRTRLDTLADAEIMDLAETASEPPSDSAIDYIRRITTGDRQTASLASRRMPTPMPSMSEAPPSRVSRAMPALSAPSVPAVPARDVPTEVPSRATRSQWERVDLGPDVELHFRRPLTRPTAKRVDRLIEIARDLFEEDLP